MKGSGQRRLLQLLRMLRRTDSLLLLLVLLLGLVFVWRYGQPGPSFTTEPGEASPALLAEDITFSEGGDELPPAGEPVRFLMYNVQNYFVSGEKSRSKFVCQPKSKKAREAVADVIAAAAPEVVGLVEIGGEKALADLRERLASRGLNYNHSLVLERMGEDRALAILSYYPLVSNDSRRDWPLYGQKRRKMLRGILDVTIELPDERRFRIVGAHLKSRVGHDEPAAQHLRSREARTLAFYLHEQMARRPHLPVLVYGDWNDGPDDAALGVLRHGVSKKSALNRLSPKDSRGHDWTIYHKSGRQYFVFDQIYVDAGLRKRMGSRSECGIVDCPSAETASDHRAIWCELR